MLVVLNSYCQKLLSVVDGQLTRCTCDLHVKVMWPTSADTLHVWQELFSRSYDQVWLCAIMYVIHASKQLYWSICPCDPCSWETNWSRWATAASAERATTSPFLVPVGSMRVNISLHMKPCRCGWASGSFSQTLNRKVFASICENGEQGGVVFWLLLEPRGSKRMW